MVVKTTSMEDGETELSKNGDELRLQHNSFFETLWNDSIHE